MVPPARNYFDASVSREFRSQRYARTWRGQSPSANLFLRPPFTFALFTCLNVCRVILYKISMNTTSHKSICLVATARASGIREERQANRLFVASSSTTAPEPSGFVLLLEAEAEAERGIWRRFGTQSQNQFNLQDVVGVVTPPALGCAATPLPSSRVCRQLFCHVCWHSCVVHSLFYDDFQHST